MNHGLGIIVLSLLLSSISADTSALVNISFTFKKNAREHNILSYFLSLTAGIFDSIIFSLPSTNILPHPNFETVEELETLLMLVPLAFKASHKLYV